MNRRATQTRRQHLQVLAGAQSEHRGRTYHRSAMRCLSCDHGLDYGDGVMCEQRQQQRRACICIEQNIAHALPGPTKEAHLRMHHTAVFPGTFFTRATIRASPPCQTISDRRGSPTKETPNVVRIPFVLNNKHELCDTIDSSFIERNTRWVH